MEIEKKYLVTALPEKLEQYEKWEIEQFYLCDNPTIRIRRKNDDYILTYKNHRQDIPANTPLCVADEVEMPLTKEAFLHLQKKADGICIRKTRYRIPYNEFIIELDVFHDYYDGLYLAEVEFPTAECSENFSPPNWFGKDVSGNINYTNSHLSKKQMS